MVPNLVASSVGSGWPKSANPSYSQSSNPYALQNTAPDNVSPLTSSSYAVYDRRVAGSEDREDETAFPVHWGIATLIISEYALFENAPSVPLLLDDGILDPDPDEYFGS